MIGTAMISYYIYVNKGRFVGILFSYWIITLFAFDISGAHFNPCITLAEMFRKNSNFGQRRLKGVLYIFFQFLGAMLCSLACATILKIDHDELYKQPSKIVNRDTQAIQGNAFTTSLSETFGTFLFVLFFMISTDKKTRYSNDKVMNSLVISASYMSACVFSGGPDVTHENPLLNPSIAMAMSIFGGSFEHPQYIVFPFFGALIAIIFYEAIFVKTIAYLHDEEEGEGEDNEEPLMDGQKNQLDAEGTPLEED
jgi:glycerol uptake facilitator-like aquaporin